jgi:anti-sigma factor RsiW
MLLKGEDHTGGEHPADEVIAGYLDARLNAEECRVVETHLATCEPCRLLVAESARMLRDPNAAKRVTTDPARDEPARGD